MKVAVDKALIEQAHARLSGIHPGNMTPMAEDAWREVVKALRAALAEPVVKDCLTTEPAGEPVWVEVAWRSYVAEAVYTQARG